MAKHEPVTGTYDRWHTLYTWCGTLGCCSSCSVGSACAILQRESGNQNWGKPVTAGCVNSNGSEVCLNLVRNNWKDCPK